MRFPWKKNKYKYQEILNRFNKIKYIIELKYIGDGRFLFNDNYVTTYEDIKEYSLNFPNHKQKLDLFIRELKILRITNKDDSKLINRMIVNAPKKRYV